MKRASQICAQLPDGGIGAVGEVRVAVPELLGEIELQPLRDLHGALRGCTVDAVEALDHLRRRSQHRLTVATPLALAAVERRAAANRDQRVLQHGAAAVVRVHVTRRDRLHPQVLRQVTEEHVPSRVAPLEWPLQLDVEAVAPERLRQAGGTVRVAQAEPVARAPGEADEALAELRHGLQGDGRRQGLTVLTARTPRPCMRGGEDAAEVGVAAAVLAEQRHVSAPPAA